MSVIEFTQPPLAVAMPNKREMRTQFAALCYRIVRDKPEILLVTSRGSRRWIIPKGWPLEGTTPAEAARIEAWEEAGVKGRAFDQCLGLYSYVKAMDTGPDLTCAVLVYPVKVKSLADTYPEKSERKRKWLSPKKAAARVAEPELKSILKSFDPRHMRR
ncbi:NUDIX hydrolase [Roseobacteraceae bacterium S113]